MAEQISDEEFKSQVLEFIGVANQKFDGLIVDVRSNSVRLDKLEQRIEHLAQDHGARFDAIALKIRELSSDLKTLTSQFNRVGSLAIGDTERINQLEERVGALEAEAR
jgi:outer membrane murein-binding lipoprotein Lpp